MIRIMTLLAAVTLGAAPADAADSNPLIGAWHLVQIDEQAPDGTTIHHSDLKGNLIYTPTGRMSVQVMYPDENISNEYTRGGYEGSFGSYTVDAKAHRVTHHVEGAGARQLVGANLPRTFRISGNRLTISPVRDDEHWSVIWERY